MTGNSHGIKAKLSISNPALGITGLSQQSERKVIFSACGSGWSSGGSGSRSRHCCRSSYSRSGGGGSSSHSIGIHTYHAPCTQVVVPAAIVFTGINVERHCQLIANLNVEVTQTVLAKDAEHTLLGILLMGLYHEFLHLPVITGALGHTTTRLTSHDNLTCNFHLVWVIVLLILITKRNVSLYLLRSGPVLHRLLLLGGAKSRNCDFCKALRIYDFLFDHTHFSLRNAPRLFFFE